MGGYLRVLVAVVALTLTKVRTVDARRCYFDDKSNRFECTNELSTPARIAIGVFSTIAGLLILNFLYWLIVLRRRRVDPVNGGRFAADGSTQLSKPTQEFGSYQPRQEPSSGPSAEDGDGPSPSAALSAPSAGHSASSDFSASGGGFTSASSTSYAYA